MNDPVRRHLVTVDGSSDRVQAWVDAFVTQARAGAGGWPHSHPEIIPTHVSVETLRHCIDKYLGESSWLTSSDPTRQPSTSPTDPSSGSAYHNMLHALLGDFH